MAPGDIEGGRSVVAECLANSCKKSSRSSKHFKSGWTMLGPGTVSLHLEIW